MVTGALGDSHCNLRRVGPLAGEAYASWTIGEKFPYYPDLVDFLWKNKLGQGAVLSKFCSVDHICRELMVWEESLHHNKKDSTRLWLSALIFHVTRSFQGLVDATSELVEVTCIEPVKGIIPDHYPVSVQTWMAGIRSLLEDIIYIFRKMLTTVSNMGFHPSCRWTVIANLTVEGGMVYETYLRDGCYSGANTGIDLIRLVTEIRSYKEENMENMINALQELQIKIFSVLPAVLWYIEVSYAPSSLTPHENIEDKAGRFSDMPVTVLTTVLGILMENMHPEHSGSLARTCKVFRAARSRYFRCRREDCTNTCTRLVTKVAMLKSALSNLDIRSGKLFV